MSQLRLDPRERPERDALHLRNGLANFGKETLLVLFRQATASASAPNTPDSRVMTRYGHPSRSPSTTISGSQSEAFREAAQACFVPR